MSALPAAERAALRAHLAAVAVEAGRAGRRLLAAWRVAAPDAEAEPLRVFARAGAERCYWEARDAGLALAGCGAAAVLAQRGAGRFRHAARDAAALWSALRTAGAPGASALDGPLLVGGFAFADDEAAAPDGVWRGFPPLRFVLPALLVVRRGGAVRRTLSVAVPPGAHPDALLARAEALLAAPAPAPAADPDAAAAGFSACADRPARAYRAGVAAALAAIGRGDLEKVVLARACRVERRDAFEPARVLAALRALHPRCFVFAVGRGDACFVGATPERLLRREGDRLLASALAASAARGRSPEEDERLGRALRESKKEQAEHAVVRDAIARALAPLCDPLVAPEAPELLRLDGIQHLHTPIEGRLRRSAPGDLLALAGRLHPTPAVAGAPRAEALAFLAAHERLARGWYTGGVGWLAPTGEGELAVALRCALLRGRRADLFAGAGIVAGSDPDAELAETRLKLRAALPALVEL